LRAIDDTLDKNVDESQYQNPQIQRLFAAIENNLVSPQERFTMIEEYNREQLKLQEQQEAKEEGEKKGKQEERLTIARTMLTKGLADALIAELTGLSREEIAGLKADN